jgi:hypothetical protein
VKHLAEIKVFGALVPVADRVRLARESPEGIQVEHGDPFEFPACVVIGRQAVPEHFSSDSMCA